MTDKTQHVWRVMYDGYEGSILADEYTDEELAYLAAAAAVLERLEGIPDTQQRREVYDTIASKKDYIKAVDLFVDYAEDGVVSVGRFDVLGPKERARLGRELAEAIEDARESFEED